jgi:hypothetical protein
MDCILPDEEEETQECIGCGAAFCDEVDDEECWRCKWCVIDGREG